MNTRKLPLALLLFVTLGAVIAILPIAIPNYAATASQFNDPDNVPRSAENYVSAFVQSRIQWVPNNALPFVGWQFVDLRTGKTLRMNAGDKVPVEFSDGSTMLVVFTGLPSDQYGFHFRTVARSLRPPGYVRPRQPPVGGSPIAGGGGGTDHYVHLGGEHEYRIGPDKSCNGGSIADCERR